MSAISAAELVAITIQQMKPPTFGNEDELQEALAAALNSTGSIVAKREVRLSDGVSRIDIRAAVPASDMDVVDHFLVGVEVKVKGGQDAVLRQLERYAACWNVDALVLVSTRVRHLKLPGELNGKPLVIASLVGFGL